MTDSAQVACAARAAGRRHFYRKWQLRLARYLVTSFTSTKHEDRSHAFMSGLLNVAENSTHVTDALGASIIYSDFKEPWVMADSAQERDRIF